MDETRQDNETSHVLCVGLTPAVQRTMIFASTFCPGDVNRATQVIVTASGKAANVARVVTQLGGRACLVTLLGGDSGRFVERTLRQEGISVVPVWAVDDAPTRTCTTLLTRKDNGEEGICRIATELVEEAAPAGPSDEDAIFAMVGRLLSGASFLSLSGSLSRGVRPDLYRRLTELATQAGVPTAIDAQGEPLRLALAAKPFFVKPNLVEAQKTLGLPATDATDRNGWESACRCLLREKNTDRFGAQWSLVTRGAAGGLLARADADESWLYAPPKIEVVNAIGAGDSLLGGLLYAFASQGADMPTATLYGTACAAANCLSPTSGSVSLSDVKNLLPNIVEK